MHKSFKYRLYPNKATEQKLSWMLARCRELYNAALSERKDAYIYAGKRISYYDQQNDLPEIKHALRQEYQEIAAHVLQDVLRRLDKAFKAFFRRCKTSEHPRSYRKAQKILEKRQQALSRKKRGSLRREKARKLIARLPDNEKTSSTKQSKNW